MRQNNEEICCVHDYQRLGNGNRRILSGTHELAEP